jgi:dihydroorotase
VNLDIGHGAGSFGWAVAEAALKQGLPPGTISSDVHQYNVHGPVLDLATTLSKFVHLGMKLEDVIARATINPARTFGALGGFGTLREGSVGDVAVFKLLEGDFELFDSVKQSRVVHQRLLPVATIREGRLYGAASIPVVTL